MGNCSSKDLSLQCINASDLVDGDGDIAGPGVFQHSPLLSQNYLADHLQIFYSTIVSSYLTFIITGLIYILDAFYDKFEESKLRQILHSSLMALSDQAIFVSIALLATTYFKLCTISVYHAYIVLDLILVATATHGCSLMVLTTYFSAYSILKWLRAIVVAAIYIWWFAFNIQIIRAGKSPQDLAYSVACYIHRNDIPPVQEQRNVLSITIIAIVIITASLCTLSLKLRKLIDQVKVFYYFRCFLCYLGPFLCANYGTMLLSQDRDRLPTCSNDKANSASDCLYWDEKHLVFLSQNEKAWAFGQFLTILLYGLSLSAMVETYFGKFFKSFWYYRNIIFKYRADFGDYRPC